MRQALLFADAAIGDAILGAAQVEGSARTLKDRVVLWVHTLVALIILVIAWRAHAVVLPYEYRFQNSIETWLYIANILVIVLGAAYTFLNIYTPQPSVQQTCAL